MKPITKLGLWVLILGSAANISGKVLSRHYNAQQENAAVALESSILQSDYEGISEAESNFEKYDARKTDADFIQDIFSVTIYLGCAITVGSRISINRNRE